MTVSDQIRSLASEGLEVAEIARRLGIRYQHAYKVVKDAALTRAPRSNAANTFASNNRTGAKPALSVEQLMKAGFELSGLWTLSSTGDLKADRPFPKAVGVYAFAERGVVLYVGVATMGLAKRLYFYGKPGSSQRTSIRINGLIKDALQASSFVEIYTAVPTDSEWNGLPVHGSAGLELGIIKRFALPWNMRSAR